MISIATLTVSQLNFQIRTFLEQEIGAICVIGELSNFKKHSSGHMYFILKDDTAQIRCVYFRNYHNPQNQQFSDGQQVIAIGLVSLYESRGDYQLIVQELNNYGTGELSRQFELLKKKLENQGLFAANRKRHLPKYPSCIGVITSATGAALQDILTTLARRYPIAEVVIYASDVQGKQAVPQLISAISRANNDMRSTVIILARGGGSIEDLWAFNSEQLALTIYNSKIPIITGIGHKTDSTIADFVADMSAATPTAAAEMASPNKIELYALLSSYIIRLKLAINRIVLHINTRIAYLITKIATPAAVINRYWQRLDFLQQQLQYNIARKIMATKQDLAALTITLQAINPLATLERGYAIASHNGKILYNDTQVTNGDTIDIQLASGSLYCNVLTKR